MVKLIGIIILILSFLDCLGQSKYQIDSKRISSNYPIDGLNPDTVNLYDTARNINFCRYLNQWYFYNCEPTRGNCRLSEQDVFVLNSNWNDTLKKAYYFRYHDQKNQLEWEGLLHPRSSMLAGDINYYISGIKVRTEHYNMYTYVLNDKEYWLHDGPGKDGVWSYYNKDGVVIKKEEYGFKYDAIIDYVYPVKRILFFNDNGEFERDSLVNLPKTHIK
jgi:hypothetical protein